ncbi:MAG: hypothetical protein ACOYBX_05880 [Mycobacterium sp.]
MKRIAVSAVLAGGLFAGVLGLAGTAAATEIHVGPGGAGVTAADGGGILVGPDGVRVLLPGTHGYDGRYGHDYDRPYGMHAAEVNPCYPDYCVR